MKLFKRILLALAALSTIAVGVLGFYAAIHHDPRATGSGGGEDKYMFLTAVDMRLKVANSGDLTVTERIDYDLGGKAWHGLYQDIILNNNEKVEDVRVYKQPLIGDPEPMPSGSGIVLGKGGAYGTYGYGVVNDPSRRLRVVWNVNDTGAQTYIVRYRLAKAVRNYRDASYLLWDVWGTGWETGVGRLSTSVDFPGRVRDFYVRTDGLQYRVSKPKISGDQATFQAHDLPAGRYVQVRGLGKPLSGVGRIDKDITPSFKAEEASFKATAADQTKKSAELRERSPVWFGIWALIGAALAGLVILVCGLTIGRDPTKFIRAGGSYQYPPEKIPAPIIAKALGAETENLVSATLLGLLQKDVFRVLPSVNKKEDIGIRNNVGETTFNAEKVTRWEKPIAELLQHAIDDHPEHSPDFTKLKKHLTPDYAEGRIDAFTGALDREMPMYQLKRTYRGYLRRTLIGVAMILLYVGALVLIIANGGNNAAQRWDASWFALPMIGFASVLGWSVIDGHAFYRLKPDQAERVRKWETYKDFFARMDMSREYPLTVEIWDEALIYAAAFGYAKKVITAMPRMNEDGSLAGDQVGLGSIATNAYAVSALSSMTSGMSSVTGMSTSSSSGGGGGGSSGGGGGGGW